MTDITQRCVEDLIAKVSAVLPPGDERAIYVYDEDVFGDASKQLSYPAVGVIYVGTQGKPQARGNGLSAELSFVLIFMSDEVRFDTSGRADKSEATGLLKAIRDAIKCTRSPTGHIWNFSAEAPRGVVDKHMVYYQKWTVDAVLT